jgi:hypothetical protein
VFPVVRGGAGFASGGLSTAENAVFPIDSADTSPCVPRVVIGICSALRSPYPAGDGSAAIFRSMLPKGRRTHAWERGKTAHKKDQAFVTRTPFDNLYAAVAIELLIR